VLQGLRYVAGPKEWGAYQKANLVVTQRDELSLEFPVIDELVGLGPRKTPRYYRAYKTLHAMMDDPEFGSEASTDLFQLFYEAYRKPGIRDWLGWCPDTCQYTNRANLVKFYELLVGDPDEDEPEATITNPSQMRKFGRLLQEDKKTQLRRLLDKEIDVEEAHRQAFPPVEVPVQNVLEECLKALRNVSVDALQDMTESEAEILHRLREEIERKQQQRNALVGASE